jgi:hypothetical protein
MRVEPGRHKDHLRLESLDGRHPVFRYRRPEFCTSRAGIKGNIDPVRRVFEHWRKRIKRVLERRAKQDSFILAKDLLGAIPLVDIEVDNGHALEVVLMQCMSGTDSNIVVEAKPHRPLTFGVVAGRSNTTKRGFHLAA